MMSVELKIHRHFTGRLLSRAWDLELGYIAISQITCAKRYKQLALKHKDAVEFDNIYVKFNWSTVPFAAKLYNCNVKWIFQPSEFMGSEYGEIKLLITHSGYMACGDTEYML